MLGGWRITLAPLVTDGHWQIDYLFDLARRAWIVHIVVTALTGWLLVGSADSPTWAWLWLATMQVATICMIALSWLYSTGSGRSHAEARRWAWGHTALTGVIGVTWGLGAFGAAGLTFETLLIYTLALGGTALGAVSSQHVLPRSCLVSLWTSLSLLAAAQGLHQSAGSGVAFAVMIVLFGLILTMLCVRMHRFLSANHGLTRSLNEKISELTEAKAGLETANVAKTRFLAHASHDLRQPIHAIGLFAACLRDMNLPPEARRLAENIDASVLSVDQLIRSLLDISVLDAGGVTPKIEPTDLGALLARLVQQNEGTAEATGGSLRFVPTQAWVRSDPALLTTIVQNILSNAIKYGAGRDVLIGVRRREKGLSIEVHDRGPGMAPDEQARVFDEFYRADTAGTRATAGLGLGLAIVRRLTDLLGLEIALQSRPRLGTCVVVSGLEVAVPQHRPAVAGPRGNHPLVGRTVCVIENDANVREATSILLQRWGCTVIALPRPPDVQMGIEAVIADFDLGTAGSGIDAIAAVRRLEQWPVPAIVISGRVEQSVRDSLVKGDIPFLPKPVAPVQLRALLTEYALAQSAPGVAEK